MEHEIVTRAVEAPDFIVDSDRGALLNTNGRALDAYRKQRDIARRNAAMDARLQKLEGTVDEIKDLLIKALNK